MSIWSDPYNPPYLVFNPQDFDEYWESFQSKDGQLICKPKTNMKQQIALSIEQMQELHSLGMDCSDASMVWKWKGEATPRLHVNTLFDDIRKDYEGFGYTPAYTLGDILTKLPSTLEISNSDDILHYDLCIFPFWKSGLWCVKYSGHSGDLKTMSAKDLIKCAFEMLKWVLVNHPDKINLYNGSK